MAIYTIAYTGPDSDGWLKTIEINAAGTISATIDSLEFDETFGVEPSIVHVSGDIYAIAYRGPDHDGWLCTVNIDSAGGIGAAVIDTLEFDGTIALTPHIIHVSGDIFAIAYQGPENDGWLCTVDIDSEGNIAGAVIDTLEFDAGNAVAPFIIHISGDIFAIVYQGGALGEAVTVDIDDEGNIEAAVVDTLTFDAIAGVAPSIVHVSGEVYAIAYQGVDQDGWLKTYSIDSTGAFSAMIESLEFEALLVGTPDIVSAGGLNYVIAYDVDAGGPGYVKTVDISVAGNIGAVIDTGAFDLVKGGTPQIIEITTPQDGLYVELAGIHIESQVYGTRIERGRDSELGYAPAGIAELTCDNSSGDFSPENAAGAYYGTLDLGISVYIYEVYDGVLYPLFTGVVEKIVPDAGPPAGAATAFILCTDGMDDLTDTPVETLLRTDDQGGTVVGDILTDAGAFVGARDIDTGISTFPLIFASGPALAQIRLIDDQERSRFYIDVDGDAQWEDRHHRILNHTTSEYDFGEKLKDIRYEWSKRDLFNRIQIDGIQYNADPNNLYLWGTEAGVAGTAVVVPAGGSVTLWAIFTQVIASFAAFVQGTHWNTNTEIDKSGADTSGSVTVAVTQYAKVLAIKFTSTHAADSYLVVPDTPPAEADANRSAIVMGKLYQEDAVQHIEEDATSQTAYGKKGMTISAPYMSNPDKLRTLGTYLSARYKDPQPMAIRVTIHGRTDWPTDDILKQVLTRKISDRVTLASTLLGIDGDFYIEKVIHDWKVLEGKFNLDVTWVCSRASEIEDRAWLLETAGFGELEEATYLGY